MACRGDSSAMGSKGNDKLEVLVKELALKDDDLDDVVFEEQQVPGRSKGSYSKKLQPVLVLPQHEGCFGSGASGKDPSARRKLVYNVVLVPRRLGTHHGGGAVDVQRERSRAS